MWNCTFGGLLWLILPFLIGLVTGWWAWAPKPLAGLNAQVRSDHGAGAAPEPQDFISDAEAVPVVEPQVEPESPAPSIGVTPLPMTLEQPAEVTPPAPEAEVDQTREAPKASSDYVTKIGIPAAVGPADDLLQIKGIGPKLNAVLNDIGVLRFDQIAAWTDAEIERVDNHLGAFRGRIVRDAWVAQADLLAKGLIGEFEVRFGKLDS